MNKGISIFLFFALATALFFWKARSPLTVPENNNPVKFPPGQKISGDKLLGIKNEDTRSAGQLAPALIKVLGSCELLPERVEQISKGQAKSREMLAQNIFFSKEGEEFVLRTFLKDSQGGSYQQLVLLKLEGDEGLGHKQEIPEEHERNPSHEVIKSYLEGGEVSRIDSDQRLLLETGEELLVSFEGEEVSKIMVYDRDGAMLCEKSPLSSPK